MDSDKVFNLRPTRVISYFLVELKKNRFNPFNSSSAVLLDISFTGCKVEVVGKMKMLPGENFYISIPLSPMGIEGGSSIKLKCECKWFDASSSRLGCVFVNPSEKESKIIDRIIEKLMNIQKNSSVSETA